MHAIVIANALAELRYHGALPTDQGTFIAMLPYLSSDELWAIEGNPDFNAVERRAVWNTLIDLLPF